MSKQENDIESIKALFAKQGFTLTQTVGRDFVLVLVYAHDETKPHSLHRHNTLSKALEDARDYYFGYCLGAWSIRDELKHLSVESKSADDPKRHLTPRCPKCKNPNDVVWREFENIYFCRACKNTIDHFKRDPITKQRYIHINIAGEHRNDNLERTREEDPPSKLPREFGRLERRVGVLEEVVKLHKAQLQDRKRTARATEQLSEEKMWARFFLHSSSEKPRGDNPKWHLTPCPRCGENTTAISCGKFCVTCDACQVHIDNAREVYCPTCGSCDTTDGPQKGVYHCGNCSRYFSPVAREIQEKPIKVNINTPTPDDLYRYPAEFSTSDTAVSQTNKLNALRRHCLHGHKIMSARMNKREEQILALGKRADGLNNRIDGFQADFWELEQVEEKIK